MGLLAFQWGWGLFYGAGRLIPPPPPPGAPAVLQDPPPQNRSSDAVAIEMDARSSQQLQLLDEQVGPINSTPLINYSCGGGQC